MDQVVVLQNKFKDKKYSETKKVHVYLVMISIF